MNLDTLEHQLNSLAQYVASKYEETAFVFWKKAIVGGVLRIGEYDYTVAELMEIVRLNPSESELYQYNEQKGFPKAKPLKHFTCNK